MGFQKPLANVGEEVLLPIRVLILDVDGVLTNGGIGYTSAGEEIKFFHVRDGSGLKYWHRAGYRSAFLSGRGSPVVSRRAQELGVTEVVMEAKDKLPAFQSLLTRLQVTAQECAYLGDDLPDVPVLRAVGLPLAVADAALEVREAARAITECSGGQGAAREAIEHILRRQKKWDGLIARYYGD